MEPFAAGLGPSATCPDSTVADRLQELIAAIGALDVAQTLLNSLEQLDRLVYSDIGGFAEKYLRWRAAQLQAGFSSARVLADFSVQLGQAATAVQDVYTTVRAATATPPSFEGF